MLIESGVIIDECVKCGYANFEDNYQPKTDLLKAVAIFAAAATGTIAINHSWVAANHQKLTWINVDKHSSTTKITSAPTNLSVLPVAIEIKRSMGQQSVGLKVSFGGLGTCFGGLGGGVGGGEISYLIFFWLQVPNSLISLVTVILRKGEDDITQLYALRTVENICSQGGVWVGRFTSQDVINNLCYIYRAAGKQESMRLTAGSCLVRLVRFNLSSIQSVIEKLSFKDLASALVKGSPREQQISLNLLNLAMLGSHMLTNVGRYLIQLSEDKNLIPSLLSLVEQGSEVLKGKALVFVALLCKHGRRWLPQFFCSHKLLSVVDRLGKEKDAFVRQCLVAFLHIVASTIPSLLDIITGDFQQMMGGRRHGHISSLTDRSAPKANINLFPVVLHLLESSAFKHKVATLPVLRQLANLIKLAETPFQVSDSAVRSCLLLILCFPEIMSSVRANLQSFIRY
ncbi:serine/threonine-protein kinase RUNKEL-like [Vicia villosa]|uniref:serine/threonine-protein kinase RUNKEL-like n=1 Tax=Vicia villosa TaxID=3911 RepID=UPI00273ABC79|nr:serine/threonine-protein kinase RUNKEL-like [Vicia villosa]